MLDRLHRCLIELEAGRLGLPVLQKSQLGQAIRHTLGQREALVRYLEDDWSEIETNLVETAIRPTSRGKKLAFYWLLGCRIAQCRNLQLFDHSPPLWSRSGRIVGGCLAPDPDLYAGQPD